MDTTKHRERNVGYRKIDESRCSLLLILLTSIVHHTCRAFGLDWIQSAESRCSFAQGRYCIVQYNTTIQSSPGLTVNLGLAGPWERICECLYSLNLAKLSTPGEGAVDVW